MAFLIYALSKNPEVQQKVYEEVKAVLHDKFTMKDLNNLPYFDLVLKESLRMYPPVPMIARQLIEDTPFSKIPCKLFFLLFNINNFFIIYRRHYCSSWN